MNRTIPLPHFVSWTHLVITQKVFLQPILNEPLFSCNWTSHGTEKRVKKGLKIWTPQNCFFLYSYEHQNQRKFSRIKFWSVKLWSVFHAILNFQYLFNCKFWEAELLDFNPLNIIFMKKFLWNYLFEPHDPIFSDSEENLLSTTVAFAFSVMQSS